MSRQRYHLRVADVATARGSDPDLALSATGPDELAQSVAAALRSPALFERWRAKQPEPDDVPAALGATDAGAEARASARAHDMELIVTTTLPHSILRQRLNWLIGDGWVLADVKSA